MSDARKKVVKEIVLEVLKELSDLDFQERVWVKGSSTELSSLNEAVAGLFDDSGLGDALEEPDILYSPEIDAEFRDLSSLLILSLKEESIAGIGSVISSPGWNLVRQKAKRLHKLLTELP